MNRFQVDSSFKMADETIFELRRAGFAAWLEADGKTNFIITNATRSMVVFCAGNGLALEFGK